MLRRQLNNAVLGLLAVTAVASFFLGDSTQAVIIGIILAVSIGLGFVNEYRANVPPPHCTPGSGTRRWPAATAGS